MMAPEKTDAGKMTLHGTLKAANFGPKGEVDGLIFDVGGQVVQVNVPPDRADRFLGLVGQAVELEVGPEPKVAEHPNKGAHPVHKLVAFAGEASARPGPKPPRPHEHGPKHGEHGEVKGVVVRLNYAKHGEANGVVLEGGDFVHLKPDGMKTTGLEVGQEVVASGPIRPTPSGGRAIEAEVVNGVDLGSRKKPH